MRGITKAYNRGRVRRKDHCADIPMQTNKLQDEMLNQSNGGPPNPVIEFKTRLGHAYWADSICLMDNVIEPRSVDLIMTSPPFGLLRKKEYGNADADEYVQWFKPFAERFLKMLKPHGSLVIDIGGAWQSGLPTKSLYQYELLISLCKEFGFYLAQEFFWWNPSKLPTPAEWVNIRRIRVKDAVNTIFWLSPTPWPKASNRRILTQYSGSMSQLLRTGYRAKKRPSGHNISTKFSKDNGAAIPPNLIAAANTESNSQYLRYCEQHDLNPHPARFPSIIPEFFIRLLTDRNDMVFDPFAGSCVTGEVAEKLGRKWICGEIEQEYLKGAWGRFDSETSALIPQTTSKGSTIYEVPRPGALWGELDEFLLPNDGGRRRNDKG